MAAADAPGGDDTTFFEFEGMPVLSRSALQLHVAGVVNSIEGGRPGFLSDGYLNAIAAETTTAALELEAAGMWERRDGGYFIVADEMVKMAIDGAHPESQGSRIPIQLRLGNYLGHC